MSDHSLSRPVSLVACAAVAMMAMALAWPSLPAVAAPAPPGADANRVELTADDGDSSDAFGSAVALDSGTMVIAAACDETAGGNCDGSAYVFVRSDAGWVQQAKLVPADIGKYDEFGQSVAVSGDTVVVGSWADRIPGRGEAGSAYVFVRTGTTWTEQAKLVAPDGAAFDSFGISVAVDGNTSVVGTAGDKVGAVFGAGSAYVFARVGVTWTLQIKLLAPDRAKDDYFGNAVAMDGNTVLVGSASDSTATGNNSGSAYVFVRSGASWTSQAKLTPPDGVKNGFFGTSVAVDGGTAVVGDEPYGRQRPGSAYVFVRSGTAWTQQARLTAADGLAANEFGWAVDVSGRTVVVGAYGDDPGGFWSGSAYVFTRSGTRWTQREKLIAPDPAERDQFGQAVAVEAGTVVIGALGHGGNGSVFVYRR